MIENKIKSLLPAIGNCILIGDGKKYLVLLVTLKTSAAPDGMPTSTLIDTSFDIAKESGSSATTVEEAIKDPKYQSYINKGIQRYNEEFKISKAQTVQKFAILPRDFSVAGGELTATLKLRRKVVENMYLKIITALYEGE